MNVELETALNEYNFLKTHYTDLLDYLLINKDTLLTLNFDNILFFIEHTFNNIIDGIVPENKKEKELEEDIFIIAVTIFKSYFEDIIYVYEFIVEGDLKKLEKLSPTINFLFTAKDMDGVLRDKKLPKKYYSEMINFIQEAIDSINEGKNIKKTTISKFNTFIEKAFSKYNLEYKSLNDEFEHNVILINKNRNKNLL